MARPLSLFVDSFWLAGGALASVLACAALRRLGAPAGATGWLLVLALVTTLAISIRTSLTKRSDGGQFTDKLSTAQLPDT